MTKVRCSRRVLSMVFCLTRAQNFQLVPSAACIKAAQGWLVRTQGTIDTLTHSVARIISMTWERRMLHVSGPTASRKLNCRRTTEEVGKVRGAV